MLSSNVAVATFFDGERITFHGPWRSNNVEIVRYCFPLCGLMAGEFPSSVFTFQKNTEYRALLRNQSPALGGCGETIFVINNLHVDCGSLLPLSSPKPALDNRGKLKPPSDPLVWQQAARPKAAAGCRSPRRKVYFGEPYKHIPMKHSPHRTQPEPSQRHVGRFSDLPVTSETAGF
jgi:hypothetical protein